MNLQIKYPFDWLKILLFGIAFAMLILLVSCDCNWHLTRAKKKCGITSLTDTIYRHDTTFIRSVQTNTVFHYQQKDTVVIKEGRLTMKYFYNSHDSTVYLNGKCDTIRIIKELPYMVNTTELKPDLIDKYKWWLIGLGLVLVGLALWFKK